MKWKDGRCEIAPGLFLTVFLSTPAGRPDLDVTWWISFPGNPPFAEGTLRGPLTLVEAREPATRAAAQWFEEQAAFLRGFVA